jgi:ABC-type phosphate transport system substrate-binding protein
MRIAVAALLMSAALGAVSPPATDESSAVVVIVAAANPASSIKRQELARFFLKKTGRWSDGHGVIPVDQSAGSPVRSAFTRAVLSAEGMGQISAVQNYWLQQVYSGRSTPPAIKATDAEVLAFVASNPGAIGYVGAAPAAGGVKVLTVTD